MKSEALEKAKSEAYRDSYLLVGKCIGISDSVVWDDPVVLCREVEYVDFKLKMNRCFADNPLPVYKLCSFKK